MIIALDARPLMTREIGGVEQHARNVVAQWAAMGLQHEFLLLCDKSALSTPDSYDQSFIAALPANFRPTFIGSFNAAPPWYLGSRMLNTLSRTLSRSQARVFHSFTPAVPRTTICPVVQTIHDLAFELDPSVRERPESYAQRYLTRRGTRWARQIIAVSSQTKNDIAAIYHVPPERIAVVYNGINPVFVPTPDLELRQALRARYRIESSYVLAVGSDIPRRNYARMLAAMDRVWQSNPTIRLMLAGRNDWTGSPIYQRATAAGLRERIYFVHGPNDAELAQLYRDAAVTCCASSFEGFGMSVLESMACGTPVTCSDMRSLREVADDAAVYFPHDDPQVMGDSLLGLLEDMEYRRQLKYRGVARARLFTWETAARLILQVLEEVATTG